MENWIETDDYCSRLGYEPHVDHNLRAMTGPSLRSRIVRLIISPGRADRWFDGDAFSARQKAAGRGDSDGLSCLCCRRAIEILGTKPGFGWVRWSSELGSAVAISMETCNDSSVSPHMDQKLTASRSDAKWIFLNMCWW